MNSIFYRMLQISFVFIFLNFSLCWAQGKPEKKEKSTTDQNISKNNQPSKKKILNVQKYEVQDTAVKSIGFDGSRVWLGTTSRGVLNFDTNKSGEIALYDYSTGLLSNGVFNVFKGDKTIWIGTYGGGLSRFDEKGWSNFNIQNGLCDGFVYETLTDQKNVLWVATWSGVNKITGDIENPASWKKITKKNTNGGLSDDWVYSMELAKDGALWFGTEFGLSYFDGTNWKKWTNKEGLGGDIAVLKEENKDYEENMFKGSHHRAQGNYTGMNKMDISSFNPNHVTGMFLDNKTGVLWIGTWGGGFSRFDGKKFTSYTMKDGLVSNFVLSVEQASDGAIWLGTDQGVNRFKDGKFDLYTTADGLLTDFTFVVEADDKGRMWAGGNGGVTLIKNP